MLPLQGRDARQGHQASLEQAPQIWKLDIDRIELGLGCLLVDARLPDFILCLCDLLFDHLGAAQQRFAPVIELALIVADRVADQGIVAQGKDVGRETDGILHIPLRRQPGLQRAGDRQLLAIALVVGFAAGRVEPDQRVALMHKVAVMDQDLPDNAAFQVLDRLAVGFNRNRAVRDHGRIEPRDRRPSAEHHEGEDDDSSTDPQHNPPISRSARRGQQLETFAFHH